MPVNADFKLQTCHKRVGAAPRNLVYALRRYRPLNIQSPLPFTQSIRLPHEDKLVDAPQTGQIRAKRSHNSRVDIVVLHKLSWIFISDREETSSGNTLRGCCCRSHKRTVECGYNSQEGGPHNQEGPACSARAVFDGGCSLVLVGRRVCSGSCCCWQSYREGIAEWESPFVFKEEVELMIHNLSSNGTSFASPLYLILFEFLGECLTVALASRYNWVVVVPLCLLRKNICGRHPRLHSVADFVSVEDLKDLRRIEYSLCFGQSVGCLYQMLSYETQLDLKEMVRN